MDSETCISADSSSEGLSKSSSAVLELAVLRVDLLVVIGILKNPNIDVVALASLDNNVIRRYNK